MEKPGKQLSLPEWESLIEDFQSGGPTQIKWLTLYPSPSLLELALNTILRKEFPIKSQLIFFIEEFSSVMIEPSDAEPALGSVVQALRALVQSPIDGVSVTYGLKEQMMVSMTSVVIVADGLRRAPHHLESLVALLLTVINRPNHGPDRQSRAVACECLRELERAYPCLLVEILGHLWTLCQSERTHASQNYILLLTTIVNNLVSTTTSNARAKPGVPASSSPSILSTSIPLVPFNRPNFLVNSSSALEFENGVRSFSGRELSSVRSFSGRELSSVNMKELRRVVAFLLEQPQLLTPCGLLEFMSMLMGVAVVLGLQVSLLKVQFSGLIYSYDPILCHIILMLYSKFSDAFDGEEGKLADRLALISKEVSAQLVFRLLSVHWLLGLEVFCLRKDKKQTIVTMASQFYPHVFDPLALKALKLDLLVHCIIRLDHSLAALLPSANKRSEDPVMEKRGSQSDLDCGVRTTKLFEDGLHCVSAFKWLPPNSTETLVAFRMLHKFSISAAPHEVPDSSITVIFTESASFFMLRTLLVKTLLEFRRMVPVIVTFVDRLMGCGSHKWLGERLLQTLDTQLLGKLAPDQWLTSYFPIFDRIAETVAIPPRSLLELLTTFTVALVKNYAPEKGVMRWSQGSKVLSICRTLLMHHHSSRIFVGLSRLLSFVCQFFPDLEVRDNARCVRLNIWDAVSYLLFGSTSLNSRYQFTLERSAIGFSDESFDDVCRIYLRMLVCIPGKKLRHILNLGEQLPGDASSTHLSSFLQSQSPTAFRDVNKTRDISSYILLERVVPLIVKQSWSLTIPSQVIEDSGHSYLLNDPSTVTSDPNSGVSSDGLRVIESEIRHAPQEPLRVMDSNVAELLGTLRRHFAIIPDYRHMPGVKIRIPCMLTFKSASSNHLLGLDLQVADSDGNRRQLALYAITVSFSSYARYGRIPPFRIPFLLARPSTDANDFSMGAQEEKSVTVYSKNGVTTEQKGHLDLIHDDVKRYGAFGALVIIELEPREPVPGAVDVTIEANIDNGQSISGKLHSVTVGIEDMFLKAPAPEISEESLPEYYSDLFHSLWKACGDASTFGRETFALKGGKGVAAISGTRSVKLLEAPSYVFIGAVERSLASFVVSVIGEPLVTVVRDGGVIKDVLWKEESPTQTSEVNSLVPYASGPQQLKYISDGKETHSNPDDDVLSQVVSIFTTHPDIEGLNSQRG
ncbi:AP-5 complex subunit beta-1 [Nymphaea thermarum]|nr:AP-5 complex subunit beta-1 [Nymphaea thermarum]